MRQRREFKPSTPFNVPMILLVPTETVVKGTVKKDFTDGGLFFASFRSYGGTENFSNDVYMIYDTALVTTWFSPKITSDCRVKVCETGEIFEIINRPENVAMRNQYMQFKVQKVGGKP